MHTCWGLAALHMQNDRAQAETYFKEAGKLADRLLAESKQANQHNDAQTIKDQVKQILKKDHVRKAK
jgi:hypothetical protein